MRCCLGGNRPRCHRKPCQRRRTHEPRRGHLNLHGPLQEAAFRHHRPAHRSKLINKELAEINSYWARLIFSGQGSPPRQADNAAEVIEIVSGNKGAIGYIPRAAADKRVRIILDLSI